MITDYTPLFQQGFNNFYKMISDYNPINCIIKYFFSEINDKIANLIANAIAAYLIYKLVSVIKKILRHNE